jgi:hypothetical protein
MQKT